MWDWLVENSTPILVGIIGSVIAGVIMYCLTNSDFKKCFFLYFKKIGEKIRGIKSSISDWIREKKDDKEKIKLLKELNKEDIELLKNLKPLKNGSKAIDFLKKLNEPTEECDGYKEYRAYDSLMAFISQYSRLLLKDYEKIKKAYENDNKDKKEFEITDTFEEYTFKTLIKKYSENNNDKGENELTKEEKEVIKKDIEKILKTITSK